jgi:hypothetical protein
VAHVNGYISSALLCWLNSLFSLLTSWKVSVILCRNYQFPFCCNQLRREFWVKNVNLVCDISIITRLPLESVMLHVSSKHRARWMRWGRMRFETGCSAAANLHGNCVPRARLIVLFLSDPLDSMSCLTKNARASPREPNSGLEALFV